MGGRTGQRVRQQFVKRWLFVALFAIGASAAWGCSSFPGGGSGGDGEEAVGAAQFAVKVVPSDVQCIQVNAVGSRSLSSSFDVKPNQAAQLTMPGLPAGSVTFTAVAFATPCAQVSATSVPTYSSAPTVGQVIPGGVIQVTLVMTQSGSAVIGIEFPGSGGGGGAGAGGGGGSGTGGSGGALSAGVWDTSKWDNALWQ